MLHVVLLIQVMKACIGYYNFKHFMASLLHVVSFPGIASQAQHGLKLLPGMPASSTPQLHVVLLFYATQLHQLPVLSKLCCMLETDKPLSQIVYFTKSCLIWPYFRYHSYDASTPSTIWQHYWMWCSYWKHHLQNTYLGQGEALLLQAVLHVVHHVSAPKAMQLHHDINNLATCKTNSPCIYLGQMQIQS